MRQWIFTLVSRSNSSPANVRRCQRELQWRYHQVSLVWFFLAVVTPNVMASGVVNGPGLIDSGYRGEISVLLINHGDETVSFDRGDRIAQFAIVPVPEVEWVEVSSLDDTDRGDGGFGSSGR